MASKSSTVIPVRIPNFLLVEIEQALVSRNETTRDALMTRNEWIVKAITDKLAHLARSKRQNRRNAVSSATVQTVQNDLDESAPCG